MSPSHCLISTTPPPLPPLTLNPSDSCPYPAPCSPWISWRWLRAPPRHRRPASPFPVSLLASCMASLSGIASISHQTLTVRMERLTPVLSLPPLLSDPALPVATGDKWCSSQSQRKNTDRVRDKKNGRGVNKDRGRDPSRFWRDLRSRCE
jgi:hypothetical protein